MSDRELIIHFLEKAEKRARSNKRFNDIAVTLAIAASSLSIADEIYPSSAMDAASGVLHALFYFWAAASLMVYMLADRKKQKN